MVHFDRSDRFRRSDRTSLSIWQNCCPQYSSLVSCLQLTITKRAMAWVWFEQPEIPFNWTQEISEISNRNFCWMESALVVFGLPHILTLIIFKPTILLIHSWYFDFVVISRCVLVAKFSILERFEIKRPPRWWMSQYVYNKHNTTWKVPRCVCSRNLTCSLRSLVRFLIRQQLVRK